MSNVLILLDFSYNWLNIVIYELIILLLNITVLGARPVK
jgi:hypothetical protein